MPAQTNTSSSSSSSGSGSGHNADTASISGSSINSSTTLLKNDTTKVKESAFTNSRGGSGKEKQQKDLMKAQIRMGY